MSQYQEIITSKGHWTQGSNHERITLLTSKDFSLKGSVCSLMNKLLNWPKNKDVQGDIYNLKLTFQAFSPFLRVNDHCCSLRNLRGREEGGGHTRVLLVIQLLVDMKYSNYLFSLNPGLANGDPHQKTLLHKKKKKKGFI